MTLALSYDIMSRGKDATGICTIDKRGRWKVRKRPTAADLFLAGRQGIGKSAQSAIIHTRMATQGKPAINGNNHPIVTGNIVGIHNGMVFNDDKLYDHFKWDRHAQVDSEAIFAALHHLGTDEGLLQVDGSWAIAWINTALDPRVIMLARGKNSPLCWAETKNGSIVFASTSSAIKDAFVYSNITGDPQVHYAPEGFLASTNPAGGLTEFPKFDPSGDKAIGTRPPSKFTNTMGYAHGGGWTDDDWSSRWRKPADTPGKVVTSAGNHQYVNHTISGDARNPKIGDRRKYLNAASEWITEVCTAVKPATWTRLMEPSEPLQLPAGDNSPKEAAPPSWVNNAEDEFWEYAYAHEGDTITFKKSLLGDLTGGHIAAEVVTENEDGTLTISFRLSRISRNADYAVCLKNTPKGA